MCNNFSASNFANEFKFQGDRGYLSVNVNTHNSKGWTRSHREDSTAYQLAKFLAKHITAPPNIVVGEHFKYPNRQHPLNSPLPALSHLPATSKGDWPLH